MTRILFKFIFYPSCERVLRNGRVKSEIVRKSSFGDMIFLTSHDYIWLLFICFLYCAKEGIVVEISEVKWVSRLKNRYRYAKLVENARINFSTSPYCTLLFSRTEKFKFFEVALSAVLCNGLVGCIMNVWGYQHWNAANTRLDIYLPLENGHKNTQTSVKFVQTYQSVLQQLTFVLLVSILLTLNIFHTRL